MFGDGLFNECLKLVKEWKPKQKYILEDDYKRDLREFLFTSLNKEDMFGQKRNINVIEESGRSLCDIAVAKKVGIELKYGKDGKIRQGDIDRLKGQVERHRLDYPEGIIVVLVGDADDYSEANVRENLNRLYNLINNGYGNQFNLTLINKSHSKKESEKKSSSDSFDFGLKW